jgi:hypothetical protein
VRAVPLAVVAVLFAAACSSGQPATFAVTGASVDPTYWCPGGASNAHYDLHATVSVHNGTGAAVTIESVTAQMTLVAAQGAWLEKPGDRYDAGAATFSPSSVTAGSSSTVKVTIGSACTSDTYGSGGSSYGDYSVTIVLVTSAGRYSVTAGNQHEIRAA